MTTAEGMWLAKLTPRSVCQCLMLPSSEHESSSLPLAPHCMALTLRRWPCSAAISMQRVVPASKAHFLMTPSCEAVST